MIIKRLTAVLAAGALVLSACAGDEAGSPGTSGALSASAGPEPDASADPETSAAGAEAPSAAFEAALAAAGGEPIGGSVSLMGLIGGEELEAFLDVLEPFEVATGVKVEYEGTRDLGAVLQTRVEGGNPPDLVASSGIGLMSDLAAEGHVVDLREALGEDVLQQNFDQSLIDLGSNEAGVFAVYWSLSLGGVLWYNTHEYDGPTDPSSWKELTDWADQKRADGESAWCVALESGAASGWPAADFIDEIVLRQAGPEFHQAWARGEVAWTAPEIAEAFETYGQMVFPAGTAFGDTSSIVGTNFANVADPMFQSEPGCSLAEQATFLGGIIAENFPDLVPVEDYNFFAVPDFNDENAGLRIASGGILSVLNDTPQAVAFAKYLVSPEAGELMAATGRWLSPNTQVGPENYTDPFLAKASEVIQSSTASYELANSQMSQDVVEAFWRAGVEYTQNPQDLSRILESIDEIRLRGVSG